VPATPSAVPLNPLKRVSRTLSPESQKPFQSGTVIGMRFVCNSLERVVDEAFFSGSRRSCLLLLGGSPIGRTREEIYGTHP